MQIKAYYSWMLYNCFIIGFLKSIYTEILLDTHLYLSLVKTYSPWEAPH